MFSSILLVAGNDKGRNRKSQQINTWLHAWYHQEILEVFDHVFTQHRTCWQQTGHTCLKGGEGYLHRNCQGSLREL